MKHSVITAAIALLTIAVLNRGNALPRMTEITLAEPVFIIGLDKGNVGGNKGNAGDNVVFSIVYEKIEASDEGDVGDENRKFVQSATASSSAAALEALKKQFPREIAASTADYFLIGENAARESLQKYADFLSKDSSLRLTASVFIVNGEASEAAEILTESLTLDILRNYGEDSAINAFSSQMRFYELLSELAIENRAIAVPALVVGNGKAVPNGYAIIKDGVLRGFLDDNSSRGYNIIKNKSVNSIIEIKELGAATRLETADCKVRFNFDNDTLTDIELNVTISSTAIDGFNFLEQGLSRSEMTAILEKEQGRIIYDELQKTVAVSKRYRADFLDFGDLLRVRRPYKWEKIKDDWDEVYSQTPVKINIDSRILK